MTKALEDEDPLVRARAAEALGRIDDRETEVISGLRNLLTDKNEFARLKAAEALVHLVPEASSDVLAVLIEISQSYDREDRELAQRLIVKLKGKQKSAMAE